MSHVILHLISISSTDCQAQPGNLSCKSSLLSLVELSSTCQWQKQMNRQKMAWNQPGTSIWPRTSIWPGTSICRHILGWKGRLSNFALHSLLQCWSWTIVETLDSILFNNTIYLLSIILHFHPFYHPDNFQKCCNRKLYIKSILFHTFSPYLFPKWLRAAYRVFLLHLFFITTLQGRLD